VPADNSFGGLSSDDLRNAYSESRKWSEVSSVEKIEMMSDHCQSGWAIQARRMHYYQPVKRMILADDREYSITQAKNHQYRLTKLIGKACKIREDVPTGRRCR